MTSFSKETEFDLEEFEEYYDDLFGNIAENNIDYNEVQDSVRHGIVS